MSDGARASCSDDDFDKETDSTQLAGKPPPGKKISCVVEEFKGEYESWLEFERALIAYAARTFQVIVTRSYETVKYRNEIVRQSKAFKESKSCTHVPAFKLYLVLTSFCHCRFRCRSRKTFPRGIQVVEENLLLHSWEEGEIYEYGCAPESEYTFLGLSF